MRCGVENERVRYHLARLHTPHVRKPVYARLRAQLLLIACLSIEEIR